MEKLTEMRYFFEQYQQPIPASVVKNYPEDAEFIVNLSNLKKELDQIQNMINQGTAHYNQSSDICLADFELLLGSEFAMRL